MLALRGYELRQTQAGGWLVTRFGLSREAADLNAVEGFARQVGAA
jgi:hypothetical protein